MVKQIVNLTDFEWKENEKTKSYKLKRYKGLGTRTAQEAQ